MKTIYFKISVILLTFAISTLSVAGPYSPGKGGVAEAAFVDCGIAGFVGPAGEGVASTATNGNYLNPIFVAWATGVVQYSPSDVLGPYGQNGIGRPPQFGIDFGNPAKTLGPVTGNNMDIVCLGDMHTTEINNYLAGTGYGPGTLTLSFANAITNGPGADFAAFENGFVSNYSTGAGSAAGQMFAELGYVEVSTDGTNFARFPSVYLNYPNANRATEVDNKIDLDGNGTLDGTAYLTQDVSNIYNLVGKHANAYSASWGTPFNLDDLINDQLVLDGIVDLSEINFVRIVDIPGNGAFTDSLGHPIYDAWVTWGSGGMDFEALGVINQVPEPATIAILVIGSVLLRRKS